VRADREERGIEAPGLHRLEDVRDLRVQLQLDAQIDDRATSASSTSRGSRYFGMPKRIMPPATGRPRGSPRRVRAREVVGGESPEGPAPTTSTRLPTLRRAVEAPAALHRLVAEKALDRVDADRGVELARLHEVSHGW
jgi:hypothetical protein